MPCFNSNIKQDAHLLEIIESETTYRFKILPKDLKYHIDKDSNAENQSVCQLLIIDSYIIQCSPKRDKIVSGFQASLQHKIQFINIQISKDDYIILIKFTFPKPHKYSLVLRPLDLQAFADFTKKIKNLLIYQLGFHQHYKAIRQTGSGSSASVFQASSDLYPQHVAVRRLSRKRTSAVRLAQQVSIMKSLSHPCICKLYQIYQTSHSIYMILELHTRNLLAHIYKFKNMSFESCQLLMRRIAEGVAYLHQNGIMHRDIKLQNIMIRDDSSQNIRPILVDYGLAYIENSQKPLRRGCGTQGYMTPEVKNKQKYDKKCDVFSLGIVFYYLLVQNEIIQKRDQYGTQNCRIDFQQQHFSSIPERMKQMLTGMLQIDPNSRLTAQQVVDHNFFTQILAENQVE